MLTSLFSRQNLIIRRSLSSIRLLSIIPSTSELHTKYSFVAPPSLRPPQNPTSFSESPLTHPTTTYTTRKKTQKPPYQPPSSLETGKKPLRSKLPFDFRYSYTESNTAVRPIGLREPKYSPFGPGRLDREWTGVCAPAVDTKVTSVDGEVEDPKLEEKRRKMRESIQGEALTSAEINILVDKCQRHNTKKQINIGRDGLTHNMLNDIHNHWKREEAIRIKCMGVPTVDMENVCTQLEDKTFGKIIHRRGGLIVLYRGRNYKPKKRPEIPLMLWRPHEPVYPKLIKTTIDGLNIEETKALRKTGIATPELTKLARNGYYGNLVPMVRDAFLAKDLVRIDCRGLERSDYKKIGVKLRDLVPCILVSFEKEQIVVWRGKNHHPVEDGLFLTERGPFHAVDDSLPWSS